MKKPFEYYNTLTGWAVFAIATLTYLLTVEPTVSFWDCGEFIASSFKLEVGHPPGAPLFMLMARFFSLFTFGHTEWVAFSINAFSALASGFTILFLFWTITHFAIKLTQKKTDFLLVREQIVILVSGAVGALAYAFSDTFWFSAVEAEVYALSSMFTALVFWLMLKWEKSADEKYANRWIVLIAYLMGLSIGVHLLNLLTIPALVFVYYFRKHTVTPQGIAFNAVLGFVLLCFVQYFIIPGIPFVAAQFDLFFVNSLNLPFFSGVVAYLLLLAIVLIGGIYYSIAKNKRLLNGVLTIFTVMLIGYSSFALIVIRSFANTPMDENNPENMFALLSYLNREQYGDRPLLYGQYYNAPTKSAIIGKPVYSQLDGKYVKTDERSEYKYDSRYMTIFPRMYSSAPQHVSGYKLWGGEPSSPDAVPSFGSNLQYFLTYQINHMYWRYFLWNFSGRQNDIQGHGGASRGNWITGFDFLDNLSNLPTENAPHWLVNNAARNTYFMLPLLLGILGLFFLARVDERNFLVLILFFLFTGLAIILYLNQPPYQPRERDYAYAGSFYVWGIFIGLGVLALYKTVIEKLEIRFKPARHIFLILALGVPSLMLAENWDDHNRSGRYTAHDWAKNYLTTCAPNAILFTYGDNDTFPLWYLQEVEGYRTDVRVVNLSLLGTDWYIEQMQRKAYDSEALPITMTREKYVQGRRDILPLYDRAGEFVDIRLLMAFALSENEDSKLEMQSGAMLNYIPSKAFALEVNQDEVRTNGTVTQIDKRPIVDTLQWREASNYFTKSDLAVLDILATFNWKRPIYFAASIGVENMFGLTDYLRLEGFAYRLVPQKVTEQERANRLTGWIDTDILYTNLMDRFEWGNMQQQNVHIDQQNIRTSNIIGFRSLFTRLADALITEGKTDKAIAVLNKIVKLMPHEKFQYNMEMLEIVESYYKAKANKKGDELAKRLWNIAEHDIIYYSQLSSYYEQSLKYEKQVSFGLVQTLLDIVEQHHRNELLLEFDTRLEKLIGATE